MEKITFSSGEETLSFYVVDHAVLGGTPYLLVAERDVETLPDAEESETTVYILRDKTSAEGDDNIYEFVEETEELTAVAALFSDTLAEFGFSLEE